MENAIRQLLEEAGKILADRKQETQSGKCFNCIDICGVGTSETRHTEIMTAFSAAANAERYQEQILRKKISFDFLQNRWYFKTVTARGAYGRLF